MDEAPPNATMIPTIHLNGSDPHRLMKEIRDAYRAIDTAIDALTRASPNGRDYYPQGQEAIKTAIKEHDSRCNRLRDIRRELTYIFDGIYEQEQDRERQKR